MKKLFVYMVFSLLIAVSSQASAKSDKPNILVIMSDDLVLPTLALIVAVWSDTRHLTSTELLQRNLNLTNSNRPFVTIS